MSIHQTFAPADTTTNGEMVMALHCSGGTGRQWRMLAERIGQHRFGRFPDLLGTTFAGHWTGGMPFRLGIEAAPLLEEIDRHEGPIHLVGHSYGGGLALHVAAMRPERISSLTLYEPTAFHLLRLAGRPGGEALLEISEVIGSIRASFEVQRPEEGARAFVDYWSGEGTWTAMLPELKHRVLAYMPKAAHDFEALIEEPTPAAAYARFGFPTMILHGDTSRKPALLVAKLLGSIIASAVTAQLTGLGHMGPVTHAGQVADIMGRHIRAVALPAFWQAA